MSSVIHRRHGSGSIGSGRSLSFPQGAIIFDSHHPARRVYQLRSGRVQLTGDRGAIVDYLSDGDFFGENSLLGSREGGLTAKSLSPVELAAFRKSELLDCVHRDRSFAAALAGSLAHRLERCQQTIQDAVMERTERRLALLFRRFLPARPATGWVRLRFSPTNSELARSIGSTRWRIAHFMSHFQLLGWLERRPELWVLRERLAEYLESTALKK